MVTTLARDILANCVRRRIRLCTNSERTPAALEMLGLAVPVLILTLLLSSWAHFANQRQGLAVALFVVFAAGSLLMIGGGLVFTLLANDLQRLLEQNVFDATDGLYLAGAGVATGLPLLPQIRSVLARLIPIDARSIPDMVGLSVLAGLSVLTVWAIRLGEVEEEVSPAATSDLVIQAIMLALIGFFAVGGAITRDFSNARERLGLFRPTSRQVGISFLLVIPLLIVSASAGALTEWIQPGTLDDIGDVMEEVTRDLTNVQGALLLGITAGVGEEILFRGAIQPRYGIALTSLVFALIHVQYGLSFVLLGLFLTSVIFGIQRQRMNTTCCIITHAAYNFTVMMAAAAAT